MTDSGDRIWQAEQHGGGDPAAVQRQPRVAPARRVEQADGPDAAPPEGGEWPDTRHVHGMSAQAQNGGSGPVRHLTARQHRGQGIGLRERGLMARHGASRVLGTVPDGVDAAVTGAQRVVYDDPVVHPDTGRAGEPDLGFHAGAQHQAVGRRLGAVVEQQAARLAAYGPASAEDIDPGLPQSCGQQGRAGVAEPFVQWMRAGADQGGHGAPQGQRARRLHAERSASEHRHGCALYAVAVGDLAQRGDARREPPGPVARPGERGDHRAGAAGEYEDVVGVCGDGVTLPGVHHAAGGVDGGRDGSGQHTGAGLGFRAEHVGLEPALQDGGQ